MISKYICFKILNYNFDGSIIGKAAIFQYHLRHLYPHPCSYSQLQLYFSPFPPPVLLPKT